MIAQSFNYSSPATLQEALRLVAGGDAKVLAGGMSLIPLMKLRLATPEHVVDLRRIPGLSYIREETDGIHIGALTTHYEIESSALLRAHSPLLALTAAQIGDVQVRNMGTIGGSIAHADPAADYPAALLALEASLVLVSEGGERTVTVEDFLVDTMTTALEPGELVREIVVPAETSGAGVSYRKLLQPASGFAIVGVAARVDSGFVRIGITGLAAKAFRARNVEDVLTSTADIDKAAAVAADGVDANTDLHASAGYRCQMAKVYTARALREARSRAR